MSAQVFLHIGAMKTGTSYLQKVMAANVEPLAAAGLQVARGRGAAVHDLLDYAAAGDEHREAVRGSWPRFVEAARSFGGRATVLSHEYLSLQGPALAAEVVGSLSGMEVHVVLTVRDAAATLPAQWQTAARNRGTQTWSEYVAAAREPRARPRSHTFLHAQAVARMLRVWGLQVGVGRVHVVTVPPPGAPRRLLWDRFAAAVGVDPSAAVRLDVPANPSAGYASAHLLCLLHREASSAGLPKREVQRLAVFMATEAAARRDEEPTVPMDGPATELAARWNRRVVQAVRGSGVHVVGDLDDLPRRPDLSAVRPLLRPSDAELLSAARGMRASLVRLSRVTEDAGSWSTVDAAVAGLVELMGAAVRSGGTERLTPRGTALRGHR